MTGLDALSFFLASAPHCMSRSTIFHCLSCSFRQQTARDSVKSQTVCGRICLWNEHSGAEKYLSKEIVSRAASCKGYVEKKPQQDVFGAFTSLPNFLSLDSFSTLKYAGKNTSTTQYPCGNLRTFQNCRGRTEWTLLWSKIFQGLIKDSWMVTKSYDNLQTFETSFDWVASSGWRGPMWLTGLKGDVPML